MFKGKTRKKCSLIYPYDEFLNDDKRFHLTFLCPNVHGKAAQWGSSASLLLISVGWYKHKNLHWGVTRESNTQNSACKENALPMFLLVVLEKWISYLKWSVVLWWKDLRMIFAIFNQTLGHKNIFKFILKNWFKC